MARYNSDQAYDHSCSRNLSRTCGKCPRRREEVTPSASVLALLRKTKLPSARVRRSVTRAFVYSIAPGFCNSVASSISNSYIWIVSAELATAALRERIHFRCTNSIVGRTSHATRAYHWRELLLPTIVYALARKMVTKLSAVIGKR